MTRFILLALLLCIVPDAVAQRYQGSTTRTDGTNETTVAPDAVIVNGDTVMIRVDYDSNEDGKLDLAAIPSLPASLITSGEVPDARIADAITISSSGSVSGTAVDGGTVDEAYLDADVALYKGVRTNTGDYVFQSGDEHRIIYDTSTLSPTFSLPSTSGTFATGDILTVVAGSGFSGTLSFGAESGSGAVINNAPGSLTAEGESASFIVTGTDTYFGLTGSGSYATLTGTETLTNKTIDADDNTFADMPVVIQYFISDQTTDLTTGTAKLTVRAPFAFTLTDVRAGVNSSSSLGTPTFDINEAGTTVLSTKLTIDVGEETSTTAATAAVISDSAIADDAELTFDIDTSGNGVTGAFITLYGTRDF